MAILSTILWMIINRIVDDYLVPRPLPGSPTNLFGGEERIEDSRTVATPREWLTRPCADNAGLLSGRIISRPTTAGSLFLGL
jgi:hypothetical protein